MAGTAVISTIKHDVSGAAPTFRDGAGNEIGQLVKAWCNFTTVTTTSSRASFNVSSLTDNGTGDTTLGFTNAFADANYGFSAMASRSNIGNQCMVPSPFTSAPTTTAFRLVTNTSAAAEDSTYCSVSFFR